MKKIATHWCVVTEVEGAGIDTSPPFQTLSDAVIYAIDIADALGRASADGRDRKVNIYANGARLDLSLSVIPGGFNAGEG